MLLHCWYWRSWYWRGLFRVPWTAWRSNQSVLKETNLEHSLEGLMLKLKLQYSGHLTGRSDSLEKILMLGKIEGERRREQQRMRCLDSTTESMDMNLSKLREIMKGREAWCATVHGDARSQTWLRDWTTIHQKHIAECQKLVWFGLLLNWTFINLLLSKLASYELSLGKSTNTFCKMTLKESTCIIKELDSVWFDL